MKVHLWKRPVPVSRGEFLDLMNCGEAKGVRGQSVYRAFKSCQIPSTDRPFKRIRWM